MCLICIDLIKQKMSISEAYRAARELSETPEGLDKHIFELGLALDSLDLEALERILEEGRNDFPKENK